MFIDGRKISPSSELHTSVCIIGGGVAGITMALELEKKKIPVILVESGGFKPDSKTRDLYRGENIGAPYIFADGCRSRFLGGSSNCWGGWCAPFDPIDFAPREWVRDSGWPFGLEEILPYYKLAHEVLGLGTYNYNPDYWENKINHKEVKRIVFDNDKIVDKVSQFSPPMRMGLAYRQRLSQSKLISVYLHSNTTHLQANEPGKALNEITVKTFSGNSFKIKADYFILAAGGIENARLLLSSNDVHKDGLGNQFDLVGRYFMDHPRVLTGNITFTRKGSLNRLYDIKYNYHSPIVSADNTQIAAQFSLPAHLQQEEKLLNARVSFSSVFPGEESDGATALWRLKQLARQKGTPDTKIIKDLLTIFSEPVNVAAYSLTRVTKPRFLIRDTRFQIITEQEPNPLSRISLSNRTDELGMPRVKVDWKISELDYKTIDKTLQLLSAQMLGKGIANHITRDRVETRSLIEGAWHHMGTTRMNDDPKKGVTDRDGKVHDVENLFIAGSSLFPTGGANFPTLTITALALRLANHISNRFHQPSFIKPTSNLSLTEQMDALTFSR